MNLFELFVKIGAKDEASGTISKITSGLGKGLATAAKVGAAAVTAVTAAAGAMSAAFIKGTSEVAQYGDNIDKMSQKMGLSAQAYQEWDFIMQHSGTSMESLKAGMKTLANAVDSGNDAFERLGITQEEIATMNQEELFAKTIEQLQKVENETERTYLAGQLLGRGATELGALLNTSAEDTEAMRKQVHELGGVMSNEAVKAAAAYQDSLQNMQTAFSGIQRGMLSEFLPSMVTVMDGLALIFSGNDSGIAKITEGVNQFADKLMEEVPKIFELGEGILSSLATAILDNLPTLTSTATSVIIKLVDGIVSALPVLAESAIEIIGSLTRGLSDSLPTIIESAVELINTLADGILNMLPQIVNLGLDLIVSLANGIANSLPELIPTIMDVILQIVQTLTDPKNLSNLLQAALSIITQLAWGLVNSIPSLIDSVFAIIEGLNIFFRDPANLAMIVQAAIELVIALSMGIIQAIPKLMTAWVKMIVNIVDYFVNYDWGSLGKNLVDGFKKGIQNAWKNLKKWFRNLFGDLIGIAKKILGIASPSKVFKKIGGFTAEGFGAGFQDEFAHVKDDMEDALNFDDASVGINASIRKVGAGAVGGAFGGTSIGNININIDGAKYSDEQSLASAIALEIQNMTDRRAAVYA